MIPGKREAQKTASRNIFTTLPGGEPESFLENHERVCATRPRLRCRTAKEDGAPANVEGGHSVRGREEGLAEIELECLRRYPISMLAASPQQLPRRSPCVSLDCLSFSSFFFSTHPHPRRRRHTGCALPPAPIRLQMGGSPCCCQGSSNPFLSVQTIRRR